MQECDKTRNDWCGFNADSLHVICSGTLETEQCFREHDTPRNDRSEVSLYIYILFFKYTLILSYIVQIVYIHSSSLGSATSES
jgi:hypothetical protein